MTHNRTLLCAAAAATLLALTACSSAPDAPTDNTALECLAPDPSVAERIAEGASGAAITPTASAAVKAPDMKDAYLVAVTFTTEGLDGDDTGVWAVTDIEGGSTSVLAVDGTAHSFTTWPNTIGGETLNTTEPGAAESIACLDK